MALTLKLLNGPSKAIVGSVFAGLAADLSLSSSNPARCYVYRPVYDEETFQSLYGTTEQQALASYKAKRPVGLAAIARLGAPSHIALTFGRNVGLAVLIAVNRWLLAALEEEEKAEAEGREPEMSMITVEELQTACVRGSYNACVDLAVQTTRAALDAKAVEALRPQLAMKLIKDLRQSAVRKGRLDWYMRVHRVARTAAFSEATWWTADFLVSCVLEAYSLLLKATGSWQQRVRRLTLRCGLHAVRAVVVLGAGALGHGVGSASPRARGFAMWAASTAAIFMTNSYMFALMNRLVPTGLPPPPPGPAGGTAGDAAAPALPAVPDGGMDQQRLLQQAPGGGIMLVGQQLHPDAAAAMAAAAAAAPAAGDMDDGAARAGGQPAADGPAEPLAAALEAAAAAPIAEQPGEAADAGGMAAAPAPHRLDAAVQAGAPEAAEPPIPAPQQRRVVGGPRLPERPARRNAAAGPDAPAVPNAAVAAPGAVAPPPAAPATPQFRTDQRAPTPAGDSEEAEARAAAAAAAASPAGGSGTPGASSSSSPAPPGDGDATHSGGAIPARAVASRSSEPELQLPVAVAPIAP